MKCKICNHATHFYFQSTILNKYNIQYFHCHNCGFLQTEEPFWIEEAYNETINISDTGIMSRNLRLSQIVTLLIYFFFNKKNKYLDLAGGYGVFTRLMRDIGFDYYWSDKYSVNLVARGFEYDEGDKIELITSFESFEHFIHPVSEIELMLKISKNILFSTELIQDKPPMPNDWWYYGLEHGQHISFYHKKTLEYIAKKYKLNLYSNGKTLHLLTEKKLNNFLFQLVIRMNKFGVLSLIQKFIKTKTIDDMYFMIKRIQKG